MTYAIKQSAHLQSACLASTGRFTKPTNLTNSFLHSLNPTSVKSFEEKTMLAYRKGIVREAIPTLGGKNCCNEGTYDIKLSVAI